MIDLDRRTMGRGPSTARPDWWRRVTSGALIAGVLARVLLIFTPSSFGGDAWRQSDTAEIARQLSRHDLNIFMPRIAWGGSGPGFVESELPVQPWLTALLYRVFGEHPTLGRLVSALFSIATLFLVALIARRRLSTRGAALAVLVFALSPETLRYSAAFMPEPTALFFAVLGWWAFEHWVNGQRRRDLVIATGAFAFALLCKSPSLLIPIWLGTGLLLTRRDLVRRQLLPLLTSAVAIVVPYAAWATWSHHLYSKYGNTFGVGFGGDRKYAAPSTWLSPTFWFKSAQWDSLHVLAIGLIVPLVVGIVVTVRERTAPIALGALVWLIPFSIATSRYAGFSNGPQYQVWLLLPIVLMVGMGADRLLGQGRRIVAVLGACAVLAAGVSAVTFAQLMTTGYDRDLAACARVLDHVSAPGDLIAVVTNSNAKDGAITNNFQEPTLFYLADRKGFPIALDQRTAASISTASAGGAKWFVDPQLSDTPAGFHDGLTDLADPPAGCFIAALS